MPSETTLDLVVPLRKDAESVCINLGNEIDKILARFGLAPGQEVRVRFTAERLEIRPRRDALDVQAGLRGLMVDFGTAEEKLQLLASHLPEPSDEDDESRPPSLDDELHGVIDSLLADEVRPAIRKLTTAADVTPEDLHKDWELRHKDRLE